MSLTILTAEVFGFKFIVNPEWFQSTHKTRYGDFFDFDTSDHDGCDFNDVLHADVSGLDVAVVDSGKDAEHAGNDLCRVSREHVNYRVAAAELVNSQSPFIAGIEEHVRHQKKNTVYLLQLEYGKQRDFMGECVTYDIFRKAFKKRKDRDILEGKTRSLEKANVFVIVIQFRNGDIHANREDLDALMLKVIPILKTLLYSEDSVLYGSNSVEVYFMTELAGNSDAEGSNVKGDAHQFDRVFEAFPPGFIRLRADPAQHMEDMDLVSIADVFIMLSASYFPSFLTKAVGKPGLVVVVAQDFIYAHGTGGISRSVVEHQNVTEFNEKLCPMYRVDDIHLNCEKLGLYV